MQPTKQNGARAKILRTLSSEGMMTVNELAESSGLTASQARDNANHCVNDGLVTKGRDDVTHSLAYKITLAGREYLAERCGKAEQELSDSGDGVDSAAAPTVCTVEDFNKRHHEHGRPHKSEAALFICDPTDFAAPGILLVHSSVEDSGPADPAISVDAIDATEPAPPPEQYAICRAGQGHLSAWPLRDMTIESARQLAIDDAAAIGGEVVLYRCTPIGKAFPRIVFEEA